MEQRSWFSFFVFAALSVPGSLAAQDTSAPPEAVAPDATASSPTPDAQPEVEATTPATTAATATAAPTEPVPAGLPEDSGDWDPPSDGGEGWDWVMLDTGEWLKGTVESFRDDTLTLDSDHFGDLEIDLDDIAGFYVRRPHVFQLDDRSELVGVGTLKGDELTINGTRFSRARLMSMVDGEPRELNFWSMKLNLSLSVRGGNTQQTTFSDHFFTRREAPSNRFTIDTNGTFGRVDGSPNVQTQTGLAQFDVFLSKRFYVTPALLNGTHDRFQNIDLRLTPASGLGMHVIDMSEVEWDVEGGVGYQYLRYRSVPAGDEDTFNDAMVRLATRLSADVGDPLEIDLSWASTLIVTAMGRTYHHGVLTFALEVTDALDATISAVYDRVEQPAARDDGTVPKSNDVQLNFGVQLDL